ncbi:YdcF family protein [Kordiimonas aestuarii]|uniref:YdcF family protein n=1 Tax=Kordiimonas aestuarii TaxID=1005925 RepID=UPI0021D16B6F|nr:YdcF family protein [Kordiimonas aestuarii]
MERKKTSITRHIVRVFAYLVAAWLLGFGYFLMTMPEEPAEMQGADAIVVLTGGAGRLEAGLELLEAKVAKRMLISGVNPVVKSGDLSALTGAEQTLFNCCVDLGKAALNTKGNADETAEWANVYGFSSIVLVTADYHMPRSLILFRRAMPKVHIVAHPVSGEWPILFLAKEYSKYIVTLVRHARGPN